ncbi:hypothetical protein BV25DRAFT_1917890 [Artomyces pyxidatus]|uniref:Uncharacterized protein n=1 Tax=Artomyces pyxidatus TaxID=48021 RepID=A0ACB8SWQ7_9AGAM|nr:hypothetical protein BV25DRAFT_1917890 [Artomyces pyxidatus]
MVSAVVQCCMFMSERREDRAPFEGPKPEEPPSSSTGAAADPHRPLSPSSGNSSPSNTQSPQPRRTRTSTGSRENQSGNSRAAGVPQSDNNMQTRRGSAQPVNEEGSGFPGVDDSIDNDPLTSAPVRPAHDDRPPAPSTPLSRAANPGRGLFPVTPVRRESSAPVASSSPYVASIDGSSTPESYTNNHSSSEDLSPATSHVSETQDEYGPELRRPDSRLPSERTRARPCQANRAARPRTPPSLDKARSDATRSERAAHANPPHASVRVSQTPTAQLLAKRRSSTRSPTPLLKRQKIGDGEFTQAMNEGMFSPMGEETQADRREFYYNMPDFR